MNQMGEINPNEIEEKANYYIHPVKHSSTDIAQDKDHRFVIRNKYKYYEKHKYEIEKELENK